MKLCSCCSINKPRTEFNKKGNCLQTYCKLCQREKAKIQYAKNPEHQKKLIYKGRKARMKISHKYILMRFKSGCVDCGNTDPRVLEWDHLGNKKWDISTMLSEGSSIKRLERELAKCDLVCANCHNIRTYTRTKSYRTAEL